MCGIAGFYDFSKWSDMKNKKNMTDVLYYSGSDNSGYNL